MINVFWFRRDLRLDDNTALSEALAAGLPVLPVFILDQNITGELPRNDARVTFIYKTLSEIDLTLKRYGSSLLLLAGDPVKTWEKLTDEYKINAVFINKDYEPYAVQRDDSVETLLKTKGIKLKRFRDQVIFEEKEILKPDGKPYGVFTPYRNRWMKELGQEKGRIASRAQDLPGNFHKQTFRFPAIEETGFEENPQKVRPSDLSTVPVYHKYRDIPAADRTSYLSPHLRFGTVSIRKVAATALAQNLIFLNELIWREFFMQILFNYPDVVTENYRSVYDNIEWRNEEGEFLRWCNGETGYPMVDAGMRQLNSTGYMHNRVRMITAGFLCKHLLIDWRWGEAYFALKLLDYELSSNNGNWQWAAGTGCDAAPYFRIFNPEAQQKKFDPENEYVRKWAGDFNKPGYPAKMVDHDLARRRALQVYKAGLKR